VAKAAFEIELEDDAVTTGLQKMITSFMNFVITYVNYSCSWIETRNSLKILTLEYYIKSTESFSSYL